MLTSCRCSISFWGLRGGGSSGRGRVLGGPLAATSQDGAGAYLGAVLVPTRPLTRVRTSHNGPPSLGRSVIVPCPCAPDAGGAGRSCRPTCGGSRAGPGGALYFAPRGVRRGRLVGPHGGGGRGGQVGRGRSAHAGPRLGGGSCPRPALSTHTSLAQRRCSAHLPAGPSGLRGFPWSLSLGGVFARHAAGRGGCGLGVYGGPQHGSRASAGTIQATLLVVASPTSRVRGPPNGVPLGCTIILRLPRAPLAGSAVWLVSYTLANRATGRRAWAPHLSVWLQCSPYAGAAYHSRVGGGGGRLGRGYCALRGGVGRARVGAALSPSTARRPPRVTFGQLHRPKPARNP